MIDDSRSTHTTLRRTLMVAASLAVATFAWLLVGESENVNAEERTSDAGKVLATVGGDAITESTVLEIAKAQLTQLERQRHEAMTGALERAILDRMMELEAKERGVTPEELQQQEVADKAAELPQEEVDAFWQENQNRIRASKEQVEGQIREFLAQNAFHEMLRSKYAVEKHMEPFRMAVEAVGPSHGPEGAPVTIIEFSDFECPFCSRVNPALQKVKETYGDKVRVVFRQFPLAMHPNAPKAAEASLCADEQGEFWAMHDAMFADQKKLGVEALKETAAGIEGIDAEAFAACLDSGKFADQVQADMKAGSEAGVSGTPAFFINGRFLNGAVPYETFAELIDEELAGSKG